MNAAQEYLAARVMTASPQALHLLVVEGAIRHAMRAESALMAGDAATGSAALAEARAFVGELLGGLDKNSAPETVGKVAALFVFAYRRLAEADIERNAAKVADALTVLRTHRDTWRELTQQLVAAPMEPVPAPPAATPAPRPPAPAPHVTRRPLAGYDDYEPRSWSG